MMGRSPCCDDKGLKKGPWTPEEDRKLVEFIQQHGHGSWRALPKLAGLNRCGKSCRLRWTNYLRPDIKRGKFTEDEEQTIIDLHSLLGNKWSAIAGHLAGRTDNEIKNFWNTHLKKKLLNMGIDPLTHKPRTDLNLLANLPQLLFAANLLNCATASTATAPPTQLDRNVLTNPPPLSLHSNGHMSDSRLQSDATHHQIAAILRNILQVLTTNTASTAASSNNLPSVSVAAAIQDNYSPAVDILTNTTISPNILAGLINMPFHHLNQELMYDDDRFPNCDVSSFEPPPSPASQQMINAHLDVHEPPMIMMMPSHASYSNIVINQQQNAHSIPNDNRHQISTALTQPIALNSTSTSSSTPVPITTRTPAASFGTRDGRDQMPSLVPASPDQRMNVQKEENKLNTSPNYDEDISNPSSTATTFDALNDIIDDEASNSYWKDIIQQASSPSWPISSHIHRRHFGS